MRLTLNSIERSRWVRLIGALESGKYEQTTGSLRRKFSPNDVSFKYCCLGVACEVVKTELKGDWPIENEFRVQGSQCGGYPPGPVERAFGEAAEVFGFMINWNDDLKLNFKQIAQNLREMLDAVDADQSFTL